MIGPELANSPRMAARSFLDRKGQLWQVWSTTPTAGGIQSGDFREGWITFECESSRRRLAPVPAGWETASTLELERLCGLASVVKVSGQTGTVPREPRADADPPGRRT
jgi:hypothetical protein